MKVGQLAYTDVLGLPLLAWGGIASLILLILTFSVGALNRRGVHIIPFNYHKPLAVATLIVAIFHGLMGLLASLGF